MILTVKNKQVQDTVFDVFTKIVIQGKHVVERKSIQYKHYPLNKAQSRSSNGKPSLDLSKGVRLKDLPVLERHSVVRDDGAVVPVFEDVSSYNLGQGVGEENTRATLKYNRGAKGEQRFYEYADSSVPVRTYIPAKRVGFGSGEPGDAALASLDGQEVEVVEYKLDSSGSKHLSETKKRGVLKMDSRKAATPVLENEQIIGQKLLSEAASPNARSVAADVAEEEVHNIVFVPSNNNFGFRSAPSGGNPPVFYQGGSGYSATYKINVKTGGSSSGGHSSINLPFGAPFSSVEVYDQPFFLDNLKNVIQVEIIHTASGQPAFSGRYVWDGEFYPLDWEYYEYDSAYPYDLKGVTHSNGTYMTVQTQRTDDGATHTIVDEYGVQSTKTMDEFDLELSVATAAASNDRYSVGALDVSYERGENINGCTTCPTTYKRVNDLKTTYSAGGESYSTYSKMSSAGFAMVEIDAYGRTVRKEMASTGSNTEFLLNSYIGATLQSVERIYFSSWGRYETTETTGNGVVPKYVRSSSFNFRNVEYGYLTSGRFISTRVDVDGLKTTITQETPYGTSVRKYIRPYEGQDAEDDVLVYSSDTGYEAQYDSANGVITSYSQDGKSVSVSTRYEYDGNGNTFKIVETSNQSDGTHTVRTRLKGFATDTDAWGASHPVIAEEITSNSKYKRVLTRVLDRAGKTLTQKIAEYSIDGGRETLLGKSYDIYFNGQLAERIYETYGAGGQLGLRKRSVFEYDPFRRLVSVREYDSDILVSTAKNFYGPIVSTAVPDQDYTINSLGRMVATSKFSADGAKRGKILEYYGSGDYRVGMLKKLTLADTFSADGMPLSGSASTYFDYNQLGYITHMWGGSATPVKYAYNLFGEITDMWLYNTPGGEEHARYWDSDTWPSNVDSYASATHWEYDVPRGIVTSKTDALNKSMSFGYAADGALDQIIYPGGTSIALTYDEQKRLSSAAYAGGRTVSYAYDSDGNKISVTGAENGATYFQYQDGISLPSRETFPDGYVLERTFSADGHLSGISLKDSEGAVVYNAGYEYDSMRALSSISAEGKTISYSRDSNGRVSSINLGGTALITKAYDGLGRLKSSYYKVSGVNIKGGAHAIDYASRIFRTDTVKNGASADVYNYGYSATQPGLKSFSAFFNDALRDNYSSEEYEYDGAGNLLGFNTGAESGTHTYSNNKNNQLTSIQKTENAKVAIRGSASPQAALKIFVDGVENTAARPAGESAFVHAINAYTTQPKFVEVRTEASAGDKKSMSRGAIYLPPSPETFVYDDDGNLTGDARWNYSWNERQLLSAVETSPAAVSAGIPREKYAYSYDDNGRKVKTVKYVWASEGQGGTWKEVGTNSRYYDNWNLIYEVTVFADGRTPVANKYYHGEDAGGKLRGTGGTGSVRLMSLNGTLAYPFDGPTGNIEALYSANTGNMLLAEYEYSPFGDIWKMSGRLADKNPLRFSSRYFEDGPQLYYYGFRHYSPKMKKWISKDPSGENGGANLYCFVGNDPVNKFDIFGLWPWSGPKCECSSVGYREQRGYKLLEASSTSPERKALVDGMKGNLESIKSWVGVITVLVNVPTIVYAVGGEVAAAVGGAAEAAVGSALSPDADAANGMVDKAGAHHTGGVELTVALYYRECQSKGKNMVWVDNLKQVDTRTFPARKDISTETYQNIPDLVTIMVVDMERVYILEHNARL